MIRVHVDLSSLNTFALPARARFFAELTDQNELPDLLAFANHQALPVLILGGGSNLVFTEDFPGLVIKMALRGVQLDSKGEACLVTAAAGENWPDLVEQCLEKHCYGLENLSLIPGCVGAAPIQNIGAYGVELKDVFYSLRGWDCFDQCWKTLTAEDCQFAYRDSVFKRELKNRFVITEVTLKLQTKPIVDTHYSALAQALNQQGLQQPSPRQVADAVIAIRKSKLPDPLKLPNAGSFFKNPIVSGQRAKTLAAEFPAMPQYPQPDGRVKLAAAWLIDQAGWKGKRLRDVVCHQQQALVLVNNGLADGQQVLNMARQIQADIKQRYAVELDIEPSVY